MKVNHRAALRALKIDGFSNPQLSRLLGVDISDEEIKKLLSGEYQFPSYVASAIQAKHRELISYNKRKSYRIAYEVALSELRRETAESHSAAPESNGVCSDHSNGAGGCLEVPRVAYAGSRIFVAHAASGELVVIGGSGRESYTRVIYLSDQETVEGFLERGRKYSIVRRGSEVVVALSGEPPLFVNLTGNGARTRSGRLPKPIQFESKHNYSFGMYRWTASAGARLVAVLQSQTGLCGVVIDPDDSAFDRASTPELQMFVNVVEGRKVRITATTLDGSKATVMDMVGKM